MTAAETLDTKVRRSEGGAGARSDICIVHSGTNGGCRNQGREARRAARGLRDSTRGDTGSLALQRILASVRILLACTSSHGSGFHFRLSLPRRSFILIPAST
jgi:hypothetical protein